LGDKVRNFKSKTGTNSEAFSFDGHAMEFLQIIYNFAPDGEIF